MDFNLTLLLLRKGFAFKKNKFKLGLILRIIYEKK